MAITKTVNVMRVIAERKDLANNEFCIRADIMTSVDDPDDNELPITSMKEIYFEELDAEGNLSDLSLVPALVARVANSVFTANTSLN